MMISSIIRRIGLILRRDSAVYTEIRFDPKATLEAAVIILVISVITAFSAALASTSFASTLVIRFLAGILLNWVLWSYIIVFVLTNFYGVDAEFWQVARLIGYANLPMVFTFLEIFSCLSVVVIGLTWIVTMVLAFFMIRESFETSTERALVALGAGWAAILLVDLALKLVFHLG